MQEAIDGVAEFVTRDTHLVTDVYVRAQDHSIHAVTIPRGEFVRHFPRVKSGKSTGRL